MEREHLLTSESVSEGHPDKMADQISDAILDAFLAQDPFSRVGCETLLAKNLAVIALEFRSDAKVSITDVARQVIRDIGYTDLSYGFDYRTCEVITSISPQSEEIADAVGHPDGEIGASDQGTVFGYATRETPELMPLPISLAHRLVQKQAEVRKSGVLSWLRPDAKSQVTVRYLGLKPISVEKMVLSTQHSPGIGRDRMQEEVIAEIIEKVIPEALRAKNIQYLVNPSGSFTSGGPQADSGLTGRKIVVDTYGGSCPHGGGAFSGKDPTKVDRSAAYMARYMAKNIVAARLAERCTVQLSYAIGVAEPLSLIIDLHGTGAVDEQRLEDVVRRIFPLTPKGIIETLDLRRPIYKKTAAYGHFGRELPEFTWEKTDKTRELRGLLGLQGGE